MGNEDLYLRAVEELEQGVSPAVWRRLKEAAGWDEHGARALYVKMRVQELRQEREDSRETEEGDLRSLHGSQRRARIAELLGDMADVLKLMEDQARASRSSWGRAAAVLVVPVLAGLYVGGWSRELVDGAGALVAALVGASLASVGYVVGAAVGGWLYSLSRRRRALAARLTELDQKVHELRILSPD